MNMFLDLMRVHKLEGDQSGRIMEHDENVERFSHVSKNHTSCFVILSNEASHMKAEN